MDVMINTMMMNKWWWIVDSMNKWLNIWMMNINDDEWWWINNMNEWMMNVNMNKW